jgi:ornithine cyclodeaminase
MNNDDILILTAADVMSLVHDREFEMVEAVKTAYELHWNGQSALPNSTFLHFPQALENRIIALPAYLGLESGVAGVKWISSFPKNIERGLERASAIIVLNSVETGRPTTIIEGSIISAKRTAASAALAALHLHPNNDTECVGIIGTGLINFEIVRFLLKVLRNIKTLVTFDLSLLRAERFRKKCEESFAELKVVISEDVDTVLESASLISIATTPRQPHISSLAAMPRGSTVLHISLRDLTTEVILSNDNIVDDIDHVCRAQTSVHLASEAIGHRDFIRGSLAEVISGSIKPRPSPDGIVIFSPFGLGVLDLAVAKLVLDRAVTTGRGTVLSSFLPGPI